MCSPVHESNWWCVSLRVFDKNMRVQLVWLLHIPCVSRLSCSWYVPYDTAQIKLRELVCVAWVLHNTFLILHKYKHACAHKIDEIKLIVQHTCVCTRFVHNR